MELYTLINLAENSGVVSEGSLLRPLY